MRKRLLSILLTACMALSLIAAPLTAFAAGNGSELLPYTKTVALADMYVGGYMNYLLHVNAQNLAGTTNTFATSTDHANYLRSLVVSFNDDIPATSSAAYLSDHKDDGGADFFNRVTGDIIVFPAEHDLYGLIVRYDNGYVYITGYPQKTNSMAISETISFIYDGNYFDVTVTVSANQIKAWPDGNEFVVSHGFGTFKNTDVNLQYALGIDYWTQDARRFALTHLIDPGNAAANLSTWYPGNGGDLIIPYFGTVFTTSAKYRAISANIKKYTAAIENQASLPYYLTRADNGDALAAGTYNAKKSAATLSQSTPDYGPTTEDPLTYTILEGSYSGLPMSYNVTDPFTFQVACALASDGGYLNLTMSVGQTYTLFETLSGTFAHLRSGCVSCSHNNTGFANLVKAAADAAGGLVTINGEKIKADKAGTATVSQLLRFTPNSCGLWPSDANKEFHTFISINIVGGVGFKPNEDGDGGSSDVSGGSKYVVQRLIYDDANSEWKWETQDVSTDPETSGILLSLPQGVTDTITIESDNQIFSTTADAKVSVLNLELETGYRIALLNGSTISEAEGFFTAPDDFTVTAATGSANSLTVRQQFGSYYDSDVYDAIDATLAYQEYQLQNYNTTLNKWEVVTAWYSENDFTSGAITDAMTNTITVTESNGEITFSGMNNADTYRIVSKMSESTFFNGQNSYTDSLASQLVGESAQIGSTSAATGNAQEFSFGVEVDIGLKLDSSEYTSPPIIQLVLKDEDFSDAGTTKYNDGDHLTNSNAGGTTVYDIYANGEKTGYVMEISGTPEGGYTHTLKDSQGNATAGSDLEYYTVTAAAGDNIDTSAGKDFGIYDASINGGNGGYVTSIVVLKGTELQLAATGTDGYPNVSWSGGSVGSNGKITVGGSLNLIATGSVPQKNNSGDSGSSDNSSNKNDNLVINNNGGGTVTGTDEIPGIKGGEQKTITITPDSGKKLLDAVYNGQSVKDEMTDDTLTVTGTGEPDKLDVIFTDESNNIATIVPPGTGGSITLAGNTEDKSSTGLTTAHEPGTIVTVAITPDDGYFLRDVLINGVSYGAEELLEIVITIDMVIVPLFAPIVALNDVDHFSYIFGYTDGTVQPGGNITREEVATIFFRLLTQESRELYMSSSNGFTDVSSTRWSNTAISTLAGAGILSGRNPGSFAPEESITRAEFAVIASRFGKMAVGEASFTDITKHWAETDIINAFLNGWVNGFDDGTFRPNEAITRAEVVTICNRVLKRNPADTSDLLDGMKIWDDNINTNAWYYLDIQEAANSHNYERHDSGAEYWTGLRQNIDWSIYEK